MGKCATLVTNLIAAICLSGIHVSSATQDRIVVNGAASSEATHRFGKELGTVETAGSPGGGLHFANGIYRGDASPYGIGSSGEDEPTGRGETKTVTARMPGDATEGDGSNGDTNDDTSFYENMSCGDGTEFLLDLNEDIRFELSFVDSRYLENGGIGQVCVQDGKHSDCKYNFRSYPNKLQYVCEKDGGSFHETEHSIECHNPQTEESLYYQFDHYPSCFSVACEKADVTQHMSERILSISEQLSEHLDMTCFFDDDILKHAGDSVFLKSAGTSILWHGIRVFTVVTTSILLLL
jgi:hypothetical protein